MDLTADGKRLLFLFAILMVLVDTLMLRRRPLGADATERPGSLPSWCWQPPSSAPCQVFSASGVAS